jgi:FkbM family methyltransferase
MISDQQIIKTKGKLWKHQLLSAIIRSKDFPTRLRIYTLIRKFWGLDLLLYRTPSGLNLLLDVNDWVQSQIYYHGNYEIESLKLFKELSKNATVVFDIGSHIGQYALECAQEDKHRAKQIFAIEVNPKTFTYLLNNIQLNNFSQVTSVLGAVSETEAVVNINIPAYWNMGNTQIGENDKGLNNYLAASFNILSLLKNQNIGHIDLVKIDVEGHEFAVLNSLFTSKIYPANILFEFIPDFFSQSLAVLALLYQHNYILKDVNGNLYEEQKTLPDRNLWAQKI